MRSLYIRISNAVYKVDISFETISSKNWIRCQSRIYAGMNSFNFYFFANKNEIPYFKDELEADSEDEKEKVLMIHKRIIDSFKYELKTFLGFVP